VPEHCRQLGCRKLIHCSQLSETPGHAQKLPDTHLRQEAIIAIQAGTNGISTAITFAFFFLVSNPEIYAKLKAEIKAYFPDFDGSETFDGKMVEKLPYLNAVAEESLRLGAPLGSFPRVTPKGGAYIAGQYIPEDTIVGVPAWAQMISEENFYLSRSRSFQNGGYPVALVLIPGATRTLL
jgi:cytochrome P450